MEALTGYIGLACKDVSGSVKIQLTYNSQTSVGTDPKAEPTPIPTGQIIPTHEPDPIPTPPPRPSAAPSTNVAAIAGGAVGGFAIIVIFVLGLVWLLRRNKNRLAAGAGGDAYLGMQYEQRPPDFSGQPPPLSQLPKHEYPQQASLQADQQHQPPQQQHGGPVYEALTYPH